MTKILSIKQIQNKEFANPNQFHTKVDELQNKLADLHNRQLIQGATNYGSFLQNKHTVLSDIDAVIIAQKPAQLIQDQVFQQICSTFKIAKIDFSPVVISLDDIQSKRANFSFMQPLKHEQARFIVGLDPVTTYFNNYTLTDQLRSLTIVMADYNRQFVEPLIVEASNINTDNLHIICQYIFQGFRDCYRNLINIHSINNNYDLCNSMQNFEYFQSIQPTFLSPLEFSRLLDLENSYVEYKRRIQFYSQSFSYINHASEYQEFLTSIAGFAADSINFITQTRQFILNNQKVLKVSCN